MNYDEVNLDHLAQVCMSDFSLPHMSESTLKQQVIKYSSHLRGGKIDSTSISRSVIAFSHCMDVPQPISPRPYW